MNGLALKNYLLQSKVERPCSWITQRYLLPQSFVLSRFVTLGCCVGQQTHFWCTTAVEQTQKRLAMEGQRSKSNCCGLSIWWTGNLFWSACGAFLTAMPFLYELFWQRQGFAGARWPDSKKYFARVVDFDVTATDWTCLVPDADDLLNFDFGDLKKALSPRVNLTTTTTDNGLLFPMYGSATFLLAFAAFGWQWAWMFVTYLVSWIPIHKASLARGMSDYLMVRVGQFCLVVLYLGAQWCGFMFMDLFYALINWTSMQPDWSIQPCQLPQSKWMWDKAPRELFPAAANRECIKLNCLARPYENPDWWFIFFSLLGISAVVFAVTAALRALGDIFSVSNAQDRECIRLTVQVTAIISGIMVPGVVAIAGSAFAWRTFAMMNPQGIWAWKWQELKHASSNYQYQQYILIPMMSLLVLYSIFVRKSQPSEETAAISAPLLHPAQNQV